MGPLVSTGVMATIFSVHSIPSSFMEKHWRFLEYMSTTTTTTTPKNIKKKEMRWSDSAFEGSRPA